MAKHSITAVFDTRSHAEQAVAQLKTSGVSASDIVLLPDAGETIPTTEVSGTKGKGFWGSLEELFGGTEDHATYAESIRRGGFMVSVQAEDSDIDRVVDILEQHGSVDLEEREATWRHEGWTGSSTLADGALGTTAVGLAGSGLGGATLEPHREATAIPLGGPIVTDRAVLDRATVPAATGGIVGGLRAAAEDVVQVVEERLDIGKRSVSRGKVRILSSVVSKDVSENVTLHRETVSVDRRVVDRPVSATALEIDPFKERVIEMEEYEEEAVVAKSAHVVEEIGIRKDATDRVETIHDTLRSTKVDIEDGRGERITARSGQAILADIRDGMEVVGSDGVHVGMIDHIDGGRIKLKKSDPEAGGIHHYVSPDLIDVVANKVKLAVTAADARTHWTS